MYCILDFCHLCLQDDKCLIDLSEQVPENNLITEKLSVCVSEVTWSKSEKVLICQLCLQKLQTAYDFKQMCIKSSDILKQYVCQLTQWGPCKASLDIRLEKDSVDNEDMMKYHNSQNNSEKYGTLCQILDGEQVPQPVVYAPATGIIISNGRQLSYQNTFLNFVSTNNVMYPSMTSTSQPLLMNVKLQGNMAEHDMILKQLLETKKPEELSVEIDPALYNFEHFLASEPRITTSNIECKSCGKSYVTIKLLRKHFDDVHGGNLPYNCAFCFSKFLLQHHFDKHMANYHSEINSDSLVGTTINLDNLSKVSETRIQGNEMQEECKQCSEVCATAKDLKEHIYKCHSNRKNYYVKGTKPATCEICKRSFSTFSYLEQHQKLHQNRKKATKSKDTDDGGEGGNDPNEIKEVNDSENLTDNGLSDAEADEFIMETNDGKLACKLCNKLFERIFSLKRHIINIHIKFIHYQCHLCGKKYNEACSLMRHLRVHYTSLGCSACHRVFSSVPDITTHMISAHLELKKICCNICHLFFDEVKDLLTHIDTHLKAIVYKCHLCDQTFTECRNLTTHFSTHGGTKSCEHCNQVFQNEGEFQRHKDRCNIEKMKTLDVNQHANSQVNVNDEPDEKRHKN